MEENDRQKKERYSCKQVKLLEESNKTSELLCVCTSSPTQKQLEDSPLYQLGILER